MSIDKGEGHCFKSTSHIYLISQHWQAKEL